MRTTKVFLILLIALSCVKKSSAQLMDTIRIGGDLDKFYPVTFADGARGNNIATQLELGRSSVHLDGDYRGSLIAKFTYHTYNWGHGSNFIDADIRQYNIAGQPNRFIAGWVDASGANSTARIIIWLRGGTSYIYWSNYPVTPTIYDGIGNALPFQQTNGPAHTYKTAIDSYVNPNGMTYGNTAYFNGAGNNYFAGNVGIGTSNPQAKLAVNGDIFSKRVKVIQTGWPDYVFKAEYRLPSLQQVEEYIKANGHLQGIPSALEVEQDGLDVGETDKRLLQKIEELTLYLIEQQKILNELQLQDSLKNARISELEKMLR